jgi:hypothetical protein
MRSDSISRFAIAIRNSSSTIKSASCRWTFKRFNRISARSSVSATSPSHRARAAAGISTGVLHTLPPGAG